MMTHIPRPLYHFTPAQNFMNDPNGLVYYAGEYHLFYQHNPFENNWGHMSWGHAISRDLVRWEHLPVALYEENGIMIFSGSAAVDWQNSSGFGTAAEPPMVAVYTGHSALQTQNIAYSIDRGRTWTKYGGNPLIDIGSSEFRDPKVFWHALSQQWIMLTVLADQHKIRFDGSTDLKHWSHLSDFGPAGMTDGLWECPDLFQLAVDGQPDLKKWVLKVDVQNSIGAQCFIGEFDGKQFLNDAPDTTAYIRIDYGKDFYAAQSWSDTLEERRIWIGWLANWDYARLTPSSPWRGLFSIPRELHLQTSSDGLRLVQGPITELQRLRRAHFHSAGGELATLNARLAALNFGIAQEIKLEFTPGSTGEFGIKIRMGAGEETIVGYNAETQTLCLDRTHAGQHDFFPGFASLHQAPLVPQNGRIRLHIFVDSCSVEVFGNDGCTAITGLIFPEPLSTGVELISRAGNADLIKLDIWQLDPEGNS